MYPNNNPFFMPYETVDEARMRLEGCVIKLNGMPVHVLAVEAIRGKKARFKLYLDMGGKGAPPEIREYGPDAGFDLSPFPPAYTEFNVGGGGKAYYLFRKAARQFKQGAHSNNTVYTLAGQERTYPIQAGSILICYLNPTETLQVSDVVAKWDRYTASKALSKDLALFKSDGNMYIEYRGQTVGQLVGDGLRPNNESLTLNPWCVAKLKEVGIVVGRR